MPPPPPRACAGILTLVRATRAVRRGDHTARALAGLLEAAAQVLAVGAFKEVLGPDGTTQALSTEMAVERVRHDVLALYQPMCLPHFLLYESRMLDIAARAGARFTPRDVARAIRRAAHVNRFLLEDNPLHEPATMHEALLSLRERCGGREGCARERRALDVHHRAAVRASEQAEARILSAAATHKATLATRRIAQGITAMARLTGTLEEAKHILVVEAARALHGVMLARRLPVETTDTARLLEAAQATGRS